VRGISDDDVKAEGFSSRDEFLRVWTRMNDANAEFWRNDKGEWSQWRKCSGEKRGSWKHGSLQEVYDYLNTRPAARYDAWVIEFELVGEVGA
jgi:hypothetical protein